MAEKLPVIIDNRNDNTVLNALQKLLPSLQKIDIATGIFEVGSLLQLEGLWQQVPEIRILMGNETTKTTKKVIVQALLEKTDDSIESAKEQDDALTGLPAVRDAITKAQISLKTFSNARFHAKMYLMDAKEPSPVDFAIVGSSNFTKPGLSENIELNLFTTDQAHIAGLIKWYKELWDEGEEVNFELLKVIERHLEEHTPFTIYAKSLYEFFAGREKPQDDWELSESAIYWRLSQYQKDGYHRALQIAEQWRGALICDGVGLGKTFIGLMLLEKCIHDKKRVLMIVPKSAEESVWLANVRRYLKPKYDIFFEEQFKIKRHTDFGREGRISDSELDYYRKHSDVIIIDEAHHFRNPKSNRGELFMNLAKDKQLFMLTATPMNNSLDDLYHLINYIAQNQKDYFSRIRIQNLRGHFLENEKRMEKESPTTEIIEVAEEKDFLRTDELLKNILIQRSRSYVKNSEGITENAPLFPVRQKPRVITYSLKSVYETLYGEIKEAFDKKNPFLTLAIYNTSVHHKDPDKQKAEFQKLLIGLIRTLLLKRLESSFKAFEASVEDLLAKMAAFLKYYSPELFEAWDTSNRRWWKLVQDHIDQRLERNEAGTEDEEEDDVPDFAIDFNPEEHDMKKLLADVQEDMKLLTEFLSKIYRRFYSKEGEEEDPTKDEKLQKLIDLLKTDELLKDQKVLIFTEFRDTARYLAGQLKNAELKNVEQVDSGRNVRNREDVIKRFSPYYNCFDGDKDLLGQTELSKALDNPIDILISTDVLSEGLNLQDACLIINYDLHWNPVRLMQRIGRADRRLNPETEKMIDRPQHLKEKIYFWNFLPPKELEDILHLKQKLDGKILRINKTLGIEGALLTPDDPDMALKLFNERYEGKESIEELMNLERQRLEKEMPEFWQTLGSLPRRLFSGKKSADGFGPILNQKGDQIAHLKANTNKGVFACFRMPTIIGPAAKDLTEVKYDKAEPAKEQTAEVRWYFWDAETDKVTETLEETWTAARCSKDTKRIVEKGVTKLVPARKTIEKHIKNTYLKDVQVVMSAKPVLLAWMEIS
jgi:superfamily II DNA/RNA helicase